MSNSVTYQVNLKVVGDDVIGSITKNIEKMTETTRQATKTFGDCFKSFLAFSNLHTYLQKSHLPDL